MVRNQLHTACAQLPARLIGRLDDLITVVTSKLVIGHCHASMSSTSASPAFAAANAAADGEGEGGGGGAAAAAGGSGGTAAGAALDRALRGADGLCADDAVPVTLIRHPGRATTAPFTLLRFLVVNAIVDLTCAEPHAADHGGGFAAAQNQLLERLPRDLWKHLVAWLFAHPDNNLYHNLFYSLFFAALRRNHEKTLQHALQKCRLITQCVDTYFERPEAANVGTILRLCNAIRLQVASVSM